MKQMKQTRLTIKRGHFYRIKSENSIVKSLIDVLEPEEAFILYGLTYRTNTLDTYYVVSDDIEELTSEEYPEYYI